jgi:hypothetical protein
MKKTAKRKACKRAEYKQSAPVRFSAKRNGEVFVETLPLPSGERRQPRDVRSGDLQALSNPPSATSESLEELLQEGNAFEAEVVQRVEDAPDVDEGEV